LTARALDAARIASPRGAPTKSRHACGASLKVLLIALDREMREGPAPIAIIAPRTRQ
jgi:hypothetical protein